MTARMMEHEEAIKSLAAERYLLGELTESDREAYEEHLFSCPACFEQVKVGSEFVGHLRRMGVDEPVAIPAPARLGFLATLRQPLTAMAFALLICVSTVSLHQRNVISGLKQAQVLPAVFLSDGAKGAANTVTVRPNSWFSVNIQLIQPGTFNSYEGQVLSDSGQPKSSPFNISVEQTKGTIPIALHSGDLSSGTYSIVVSGIAADKHKTEISRYSLQLQVQE